MTLLIELDEHAPMSTVAMTSEPSILKHTCGCLLIFAYELTFCLQFFVTLGHHDGSTVVASPLVCCINMEVFH